ncbi:MAG: hypothetical protein ACXW2T_03495, partial [Allosphingosinicella sp.]
AFERIDPFDKIAECITGHRWLRLVDLRPDFGLDSLISSAGKYPPLDGPHLPFKAIDPPFHRLGALRQNGR